MMNKLEVVSINFLLFLAAFVIDVHTLCPDQSQCTTGSCCTGCDFTPRGTLCRGEKRACDKPEYCTGTTSRCPRDTYLPNGTLCHGSKGLCYQGLCLTRQQDDTMTPTNDPSKDNNEGKTAGFIGKNINRRETGKNNKGKNVTLEVKSNGSLRDTQGTQRNILFIPLVCASALLTFIFIVTAYIVYWYYSERKSRKKLESNIINFALN